MLSAMIAGTMIVAVWRNHGGGALEIIKALSYIAGGGLGGYGLGRISHKQESAERSN